MQQTLTIPSGTGPVLRYWLRIGAVTAPFDATLAVKVDGTTVQTITEPATPEAAYIQRAVALPAAVADGGQHVIGFEYSNPAVSSLSTFTIDDVTLEAGCAGPNCSTTISYSGPAVPVPDNVATGIDINLPVSGIGTVSDLNFRFDTAGFCDASIGNVNAAIDHTFAGDLVFKLTPPDGSPTVTFMARRGGARKNICLTTLDDEGGFANISTLTDNAGLPVSGNFSPEATGMLSQFDGENANGNWTLNVSDVASSDTGLMRRFSLIFGAACPIPTPTPVLTPTPTPTPTTTPTPESTPVTPTGSGVTVQNPVGNGSVTYSQVTSGGITSFTPIDPLSAGALPNGFTVLGGNTSYDISTTAIYTPPIVVCFTVTSVNDPAEFDRVRLLHGENGQLVDRTILSPDSPAPHFATRTVCSRVNSLSPFVAALAQPLVSVSGRVMTPTGLGLRNAIVALTDSQGVRRTATTSSFGVYSFDNVRPGETYLIGVSSKRYRFASQSLLVNGNLTNVDFVGLE